LKEIKVKISRPNFLSQQQQQQKKVQDFQTMA
jgi:hypothetical protein